MTRAPVFASVAAVMVALLMIACGSSPPPVETEPKEDYDPVASIVGDVEVDEDAIEDDGAGGLGETYKGPTKVTVNLKVVNDRNPEGSFKLLDASGTTLMEGQKLGSQIEINQGVYTVVFETPKVFGEVSYTVEDVEIAGKEMTLDEIFPAGQITLHTFRGKAEGRCVPVSFKVFDKTEEKELNGKGKTCKPLILETGHYEVRLDISKKKFQPVEMRINREQVQTSKVKLDR